jgi:hypothetical protein
MWRIATSETMNRGHAELGSFSPSTRRSGDFATVSLAGYNGGADCPDRCRYGFQHCSAIREAILKVTINSKIVYLKS